ncbi:DUF1670 domain-containing protein [Petrotoga sp. 9PWA.NaAc.5.4]|uniref:DUF1670 domain-containing protein n=1 Tax=Petrotoga sp. 9PWA.NaAc.5.4 TaxID=1434328 RepID=UPI000CC8CEA2|nr:DUF1670 domain-containing protein [Petrotoga sp. 9PWA.NaAc.5.4]PNR96798.1 hypothetical protein X924_01460 [Petrotoga sp. 9PWA.NaAc.5.4]
MGGSKEYRQKLKYQVSCAENKTLENQIRGELRGNLGLSEIESELLSKILVEYVSQDVEIRNPNQIIIKGAETKESFARGYLTKKGKRIKVTPFHIDDLEVEIEFGISAMQLNRIIRLIEESEKQDSLISSKQISYILNITPTSLRGRLQKLRSMGLCVPTRGLSAKEREKKGMYCSTWLLKRYFSKKDTIKARKEVGMSDTKFKEILAEFATVVKKGQLRNDEEKKQWIEVAKEIPKKDIKRFVSKYPDYEEKPNDIQSLKKVLTQDFNFSPIKTRAVVELVEEIKEKLKNQRKDNQVIYWAVAAGEPAGKALKECKLIGVTIDYINDEEMGETENNRDLNRLREIKFERILRYTIQAKKSGGYLTYADLSYLMGINVESLRRMVKSNPKIVIPLRGSECDIGRGIAHKKEIISLYMQMYTETEIVNKTGHSYEAIEDYIKEFATVWMLTKKGMPPAMIRKITKRSKKLIDSYIELINRYAAPEYAFRYHHLEQIFYRNQGDKKKGSL